jgi:hypothetical protein
MAENFLERLGNDPRREIGTAAGAKADNDPDRPRRPILRDSA